MIDLHIFSSCVLWRLYEQCTPFFSLCQYRIKRLFGFINFFFSFPLRLRFYSFSRRHTLCTRCQWPKRRTTHRATPYFVRRLTESARSFLGFSLPAKIMTNQGYKRTIYKGKTKVFMSYLAYQKNRYFIFVLLVYSNKAFLTLVITYESWEIEVSYLTYIPHKKELKTSTRPITSWRCKILLFKGHLCFINIFMEVQSYLIKVIFFFSDIFKMKNNTNRKEDDFQNFFSIQICKKML